MRRIGYLVYTTLRRRAAELMGICASQVRNDPSLEPLALGEGGPRLGFRRQTAS